MHHSCYALDGFAYVETGFAEEDEEMDVQPLFISTVAPWVVFPFALRRAWVTGTARITVRIGPDGRVQEIIAAEGEIREFVDAAVAGVERCRFVPARKAGAASASRIVINVEFKIDEV